MSTPPDRRPAQPSTGKKTGAKHAPQTARYEWVMSRIRDKIYTYELSPGDWIDEQRLAEEFGVSRTPLREGLKLLAAEGLVTVKPRRGSYVTKLTDEDVDQIFELMARLEGWCAFEAAKRLDDAGMAVLERMHATLEIHAAAHDAGRYHENNVEFHAAIQQLSGNRWLANVVADLRIVMRLARVQTLRYPGRFETSIDEHRDLMAALRARDPDAAEATMRRHLLNQLDVLHRLGGGA
ncbi:MAG: GntR family transcriptional regulator [Betaproteobacteria bacterium]